MGRTGHRLVMLLLLVAATTGCAENPAPAPAVSGPSGAAGPSAAGAAQGPGDHRLTTSVDGTPRNFLLHAPPAYDGTTALPLVIALHHRPGTPDTMRAMSGLDAKADEEGFLVAYPEGVGNQFKAFTCCGVQDDVGMVRMVAEDLMTRWRADPQRIFLTGASNGADLAFRVAVEAPGVFAAIAPVSGGFYGNLPDRADYAPTAPVSVVTFVGAADPMAETFRSGITAWQKRLACRPAPGTSAPGVRSTRATCGDRSAVDVHVVEGAGHIWFGARTGELADPKPVIDATDVMWDFFADHPRLG